MMNTNSVQPTCWDEAAAIMVDRIFWKQIPAIGEGMVQPQFIEDVRALLDSSIELNFGKQKNRPVDDRLEDWVLIGASALRAAEEMGVAVTVDRLVSTLVRKQADYGHDNIRRFGSDGLLVRLHDKVARIENLLARGATPNNESLADNMLDVVGYCAIGCMWLKGWFLLPLKGDTV